MRYAIFSDVHANRQAWEAVRADAARQNIDTLVCLGDVVGYGPKPLEVLTAVREVTPNFVLGNHDAAACGRLDPSIFNPRARTVIEWTRDQLDEEALDFLNQVPLQMDGSGIQFVHAEVMEPGEFGYIDGPGPAELNMQAMTQPVCFIGHTHLPMAFTMPKKGGQVTQLPPIDFQAERGRRTLINVGSVGEPRTTDVRASYVIYDDTDRSVTFRKVQFDVDGYKADLEEVGLDIQPYFVQVVDAGKVAGAPVPSAAPQLALAQLPKVAEVVAGHHGHLVLGQPAGGGGWGAGVGAAGHPGAPLKQPKSLPAWVIVMLIALVAVCVGGLAMYVANKDSGETAATGQTPGSEKQKEGAGPVAPSPDPKRAGTDRTPKVKSTGPIKDLKAKLFVRTIVSLRQLRDIEGNDKPSEESEVPEGLVSLKQGQDHKGFGLVWEGYLEAPEAGDYEFTLDSDDGAALFLFHEKAVEIRGLGEMGREKTVKIKLGAAPAPFRLEYFQNGPGGAIKLTWKGPGLEGEQPLMESGTRRVGPTIAKTPGGDGPGPEVASPLKPRPQANRKPAEKLSQDLVAYWSFDSSDGVESRYSEQPDGSVTENLVAEKGQRVQILAPKESIGTSWINLTFDAKTWIEGVNGVGYESVPGDYKDLLKTTVKSDPKKHPHSIYIRIPFEVEDPTAYSGLALYMKYDDGFVAYLNGQQMASKNSPSPLLWNSAATAQNDDQKAVVPELFKVNRSLRNLKKGWNVLAIHGLNGPGTPNADNTGCTSSDMLILPKLVALRKENTLPEEAEKVKRSAHDRVVNPKTLKGKVKVGDGQFGDGYDFEEGSIEIGAKDDYAVGKKSFSVSAWFTRGTETVDKQARRLLSAGGASVKKAGWSLWLSAKTDAVSFAVGDGVERSVVTGKHGSLANGEWHHVVATIDRPSGEVSLYLDGELIGTKALDLAEDAAIGSGSGLSIGRNSDDKQHHRGMLDDIAIWRRALVPEEVERIHGSEQGLGAIFNEETQ